MNIFILWKTSSSPHLSLRAHILGEASLTTRSVGDGNSRVAAGTTALVLSRVCSPKIAQWRRYMGVTGATGYFIPDSNNELGCRQP